jgi:transposase
MPQFEFLLPTLVVRSNTIAKPKFFAKVLDKARARIEQMMGKIKRFKRIALRCEKTAKNYASFLALVCGFILIKPVHTA